MEHHVSPRDTFTENQLPDWKDRLGHNGICRLLSMIDCIQSVIHDAQVDLTPYLPTTSADKLQVMPSGFEIEPWVF